MKIVESWPYITAALGGVVAGLSEESNAEHSEQRHVKKESNVVDFLKARQSSPVNDYRLGSELVWGDSPSDTPTPF